MNVLDKSLRVAYEGAPSGLKEVARETSQRRFPRQMAHLLRCSRHQALEPVAENGEFTRDAHDRRRRELRRHRPTAISSRSRGRLWSTMTSNAFGDISRRLGIACAMFEAKMLANLLLANGGQGPTMQQDGNLLFCADHNNYVAVGSGAVPSVTTLTAARLAMRHQTAGRRPHACRAERAGRARRA